jgi:hypothetical protein
MTIKGEEKDYLFNHQFRKDFYDLLAECPHVGDYNEAEHLSKVCKGAVYMFFLIKYPHMRVANILDVETSEVHRFTELVEDSTDKQEKMIIKEILQYLHNNIDLHIV